MYSNFLQNERQPDIGVLGSLGCTNRVKLLSSKAWNTNGSLISFDLNMNTFIHQHPFFRRDKKEGETSNVLAWKKLVLGIQKSSLTFQCKKQFLPSSNSPGLIQESANISHLMVLTARNSPVKGSCLCWITLPLTFTASPDPLVTSMSSEMARGRKPCRCLK